MEHSIIEGEVSPTSIPKVSSRDGAVMANSRDVAEYFGKLHKNVIRDIENLLAKKPDLGRLNFEHTPYVDGQNGQTYKSFEMDRTGFTLLAMGFTGEKALDWKISYIAAFDAMESELRAKPRVMIDYTDPKVLLGVLSHLQEQVVEKDKMIAGMVVKVDAHDRIADTFGKFSRTAAAKMLGVPPNVLIRWLVTHGWTYERGRDVLGYQPKINAGYLTNKIETGMREDGTEWSRTSVYITPKGLTILAKAFAPALTEVD